MADFNWLFQSTCPHGARHFLLFLKNKMKSFNPRAHTGHDEIPRRIKTEISCFNPRAHTGHDLPGIPEANHPACFNPRAHTGHDPTIPEPERGRVCFNPRAHTGHDPPTNARYLRGIVSIHVPTRGTTAQPCPKTE